MALIVLEPIGQGKAVKQRKACSSCGFVLEYYTIGGLKTQQKKLTCPKCSDTVIVNTSIK